jgi:trehalose 6-phosphate phosphatase
MSSVDTVVARAWDALQHVPAALITDIDGTISRIAPTPEEAFVGEPVRTALEEIRNHLALTAVITGREASVARKMVGVETLEYIGNYALDGVGPLSMTAEGRDAARAQIVAGLEELPCVEVEDKGVSFSLHYRACDDRPAARRTLLALAEPVALGVGGKLVEGKSVIEVVPASLPDKGTALRKLLDQNHIAGVVYFGDDLGDVAAFRELAWLRANEGLVSLSVAVVDAETDDSVIQNADLTLNGVDEVEEVYTALAKRFAEGGEAWPGE